MNGCHTCGMATGDADFHPHLFCVLVKAGITDPRAYLTAAEWSYTPGRSDIPRTARAAVVAGHSTGGNRG